MSSSQHSSVEAAILSANESFYRAFTLGDFPAMSELWAEHAPCTCLHPGSTLLRGRQSVLGAWRQIMNEPPPFEMRCDQPAVQIYGTTAVVICYEGNGEQRPHLAATNVFVLEADQWRMVHHQAGPLARMTPAPPASGPTGGPTLN